MTHRNKYAEYHNDHDGIVPAYFAGDAPNAAEEGTEYGNEHQYIPEYAYAAFWHGIFKEMLLIHEQEKGQVGQGQ